MSAETQLYSTLSAAAGVTAIVSLRIYPDFIGQEIACPAIVQRRMETEYVTTIHTNAVQASRVTLEIWCMVLTARADAEALADAVESALATSQFTPVGRRPEFDNETETFATVLTVRIWQ
jgi:hypothetical protein